MSKRKTAKHARSPKIVATAQRANRAVIGSPKGSRKLDAVTAAFNESPPERFDSVPPIVSKAPAVVDLKGFDFFSASAVVRAYQANLLDMAQANMQFTLEFAQRFAAIKSPDEFRCVIAEFTSKRIAMFQIYSKKMVEMGTTPVAR